jgi:hypothetical protein
MSEAQEQVRVHFKKPTLNYAKGDVAVLPKDYVEKVVKKYVKKNWDADEQDRYEVLGAAEVRTGSGTKKPEEVKEPSFEELKSEAVDLGVDVSGIRSKKDMQAAIDTAKAEQE